MKKLFLIICLIISMQTHSHALIINEIMSNPVGDDGGREWIEVYNNSSSTIDISNLTISIKGAVALPVTSVSGGTTVQPNGYAIIGSVVSNATKFLQDYPSYQGPLLRASLSLVNTGVTSLEIKLGGVSADILSSYTAAKEGLTLSRINGSFSSTTPTPGTENLPPVEDTSTQATTTSNTTTTQATIAQASAPLSDIVLYLPQEKVVVAGAESTFAVFGLTHTGRQIENLNYAWAYGDGGQNTGSSTSYRYAYPGTYIVSVEGGNGYVLGVGRINVRVVAPDIFIKNISTGKYGAYVDIENPNTYDLDVSQWRLTINGAPFLFPKNTLLARNNITHLSGLAMGFASTTINRDTVVKILFPNLEEITHYNPQQELFENLPLVQVVATSGVVAINSLPKPVIVSPQIIKPTNVITPSLHPKSKPAGLVLGASTSTSKTGSTSAVPLSVKNGNQKDTRIVSFFKSFFSRK
jgi:hypothetical protein